MKVGAGIAGILLGLFSLLYVGVFGGMIGAGVGWLGSVGPGNSTVTLWASMVSLLSWLAPLLAIIGGILTFSNPRAGGVTLAISATLLWYLLGLGTIGRLFVLPIGAAALLAFFATRAATPLVSSAAIASAPDNRASHPELVSFNRAKWDALVEYDAEIAAAADQVRPLGQKWLDEFATAVLALDDKHYLPTIASRILSRAKAEEATHTAAQETTTAPAGADRPDPQPLTHVSREEPAPLQRPRWGSLGNWVATSAIGAVILLASAGTIWHFTSPPSRLTKRIIWSGTPDNCFKLECLLEQMKKSGASSEAIQLAVRLTAGSGGNPVWATAVRNFGQVDLVMYDDPNEHWGYVFVDRDLKIIGLGQLDFQVAAHNFRAFVSQHPQAFAAGGPAFVGQDELQGGRKRLSFQYRVSDCMACEPLGALEVGYDFDQDGHYLSSEVGDLRDWSTRRPEIRIN